MDKFETELTDDFRWVFRNGKAIAHWRQECDIDHIPRKEISEARAKQLCGSKWDDALKGELVVRVFENED